MSPRILLGVVLVLGLTSRAQASPFTNGGFESPGGSFPGFTLLTAGSTTIPGWTVGGGSASIDWIGTLWVPSQGNQSIDLNGSSQGSIFQTFDTTPGQLYRVLFDLSGNPDGLPLVKTLNVQATGNAALGYSFDVTGFSRPNMGWQTFGYQFVASGTSTTLTFSSTTGGIFFGPALDNVRVAAVPAPTTMAVFGLLAVSGLGYIRRRKFATA